MKREVKIGLFAVAMIGAAWAGIRFLKGFDIFSRNIEYYAAYDRIDGVQAASPILLRGVKIGTVTGVTFDPAETDKVVLQLTVRKRYRLPSDSEAKIVSNGLMGNKAVEIVYGSSARLLAEGDTLRSGHGFDLMDMAGSELDFLKQKVTQLTGDLSRALANLNSLMETNAAHIAGTMRNLDAVTGDAAEILRDEKAHLKSAMEGLSEFSAMLGSNAGRVDSVIGDLNRITTQFAEAEFADKLTAAVGNLDALLAAAASGEGTVGRLMTDPDLYDSLTETSENLGALLADLKAYPARYVHFSLFGRDPEKLKEKAERRAARAAEKARQDSLKQTR